MQDVSIRISVAGAAEAPLIADISRRTFYDTFAQYNTAENMEQFLGVQFTRQQLIAEVGAPRNTFLLAWLEEDAGASDIPEQSEGYERGRGKGRRPDEVLSPSSVRKVGGIPVGYARLYDGQELPRDLAGASAIEISRIYCEQGMIGKGVGKALMEACLDVGRQKGKEWIWLCVWEHNQRAIRFYEKIGFERFGQYVFVLGQDLQNDWCMKKRL
jgi:ribosomal protein S18 acetylase RimI-like enzyme